MGVVRMNFEGFELYLKDLGLETEDEVREVISKACWVETTMDISLDRMLMEDIQQQDFKEKLAELVGSEEKTSQFFEALVAYLQFCKGANLSKQ